MKEREHVVSVRAAFDKRDPDPEKNYGIHGAEVRFVVKGPEGAVQFVLYTNWMLPHVRTEGRTIHHGDYREFWEAPMPADLSYHSKVPHYEGQTPMSGDCEFTGGACYYDGSTLNAEPIFETLIAEGTDGLWRELEAYYSASLVSGPAPEDHRE